MMQMFINTHFIPKTIDLIDQQNVFKTTTSLPVINDKRVAVFCTILDETELS